jgi:alanine-glyoxylate transaminase/serine-glyoxylate transaminase/serine-pyruvate transaminase
MPEPAPPLNLHPFGRNFLAIPGPGPLPERVRRALAQPLVDHRGPEFAAVGRRALDELRWLFGSAQPVLAFAATGTGAWEAALVNTLSPGDALLVVETGHFAAQWLLLAGRLGLHAEVLRRPGVDEASGLPWAWRRPVDAQQIEARLREDREQRLKAVCVVHNETSTGALSDIAAVRAALDAAGHPALLMVDTISGIGCAPYFHDAWGVDVSIAGSQKGLMLPPGLGFNAVSERALAASRQARLPRAYWGWDAQLEANRRGYFPTTPATPLVVALVEALAMLREAGLEAVWARHARWARAARQAVAAWGLETINIDPQAHSPVLTGVLLPPGHDADRLREHIHRRYDLSLGMGLGRLAGRAFRIAHMGDGNDLTLLAALAGCEMGLEALGPAPRESGVRAAMQTLRDDAAWAARGEAT